MGNEASCKVRFGKQESQGKALLETSEILFRGEFRLQTAEGLAVFQLGATAEKWRDKILHPKSRIEKLGVKPGAKVSLLSDFDREFLDELGKLTKSVNTGKASSDSEWIFFAADSKGDLGSLCKISKSMQGATALWIVYPKGQKHITGNDVLAAGRKSGLKDVKV